MGFVDKVKQASERLKQALAGGSGGSGEPAPVSTTVENRTDHDLALMIRGKHDPVNLAPNQEKTITVSPDAQIRIEKGPKPLGGGWSVN